MSENPDMQVLTENCHAKLNLYLAVTGRRSDGFHDLVSLVSQISLCDELSASLSSTGTDTLACDDSSLPADADNLVIKAAAAYRKHVPNAPFLAWNLKKRIPHGAGMGGGSSDAAGALRILNKTCGAVLNSENLSAVAAEIGSDCPLFMSQVPCVMRGRGEKLTALPTKAVTALKGRHVAIVKPHFGIPTSWAYNAIDEAHAFTDKTCAETELALWIENPDEPIPTRNNFMDVVYRKYLCYGALNDILRGDGLPELILTGSGSAAYALAEGEEAKKIVETAGRLLGDGSYTISTTLI